MKKEHSQYFDEETQDIMNHQDDEDLCKSVWLPVVVESKEQLEDLTKSDSNIKEMDLAAISEKEVFVRKANIVRSFVCSNFIG